MKKILFINGPLGGGGAERVLIDLLKNLDYTKYKVDLCLIVKQGVLLADVPKQVNIISLWGNYTLYYKIAYRCSNWFKSNYLFKRILKKKIRNIYDYEISFLEGMPLKLHAMLDSNAKKVTWVHCDLFNFPYEKNNFYKGEEVNAYKKMDKIICVSNDTKNAFLKRFKNESSKTIVIHNPIDINNIIIKANEFSPYNNKVFNIVVVGRLEEQKKVQRVLYLAELCKKNKLSAVFHIVGDGVLKSSLESLVLKLNISDIVFFHGFKKNPYPYIKQANLLISTSGYEGFGLVLCEAMALNVPVISTKTSGPSEILDNNKYGILTSHNVESIYTAVLTMISDKTLRDKYKRLGLKRVIDFNIENFINHFNELVKH